MLPEGAQEAYYESTKQASLSKCPDCEVRPGVLHRSGCSRIKAGESTFPHDPSLDVMEAAGMRSAALGVPELLDPYASLRSVLDEAYDQSANGKGKERHANDKAFVDQPILGISRMVGVGGPAFQAMKKIQEACGMAGRDEKDAAIRELLGAIVYSAAAIIYLRENK